MKLNVASVVNFLGRNAADIQREIHQHKEALKILYRDALNGHNVSYLISKHERTIKSLLEELRKLAG